MINERWQALSILLAVKQKKQNLNILFSQQDALTPFAKQLCFGVCRYYFRLEAIAKQFVKKNPSPDVWMIILLGIYQLYGLDKPAYATVHATVELADKLKKSWAKGLINACLRWFEREQKSLLQTLEKDEAFRFNHPLWFIEKVKKDWPEYFSILAANDVQPPMSLRVNVQKTSRDSYLAQLTTQGIEALAHVNSPVGIRLQEACDVKDLPFFAEGEISVQDESAQLAAQLLDLKPGLRVLDACCAPGGKTCHLLETEPHLDCLAIDIDPSRLGRVRENLKRLALKAQVLPADALHPENWWDGQLFDRILLDAPCSATGVIRRHPDIKLLRTEDEINQVVKIQAQLLKTLWPLLRAQGLCVYVTCSILKEENEQQIARFLAENRDCEVVQNERPCGKVSMYGWQLLPGEEGMDGFFYSVLKKT